MKSRTCATLSTWESLGQYCQLQDLQVYYRDLGPRSNSAVVFLHGFPSSCYDWHRVLPLLDKSRRLLVFDFPGYGLSAKPADYSYSLMEQADIVEMLLRKLGIHQVQLIAHDMGTTVACELLARRERGLLSFRLQALLLMNGSIHIEMAQLTPSQKLLLTPAADLFARLSTRPLFRAQLQRIVARPLDDHELDAMWAFMQHADGLKRLPVLINYIRERYRFRQRWIGALTRVDLPVTLLWGRRDPVAVAAIAEQLARDIPDVQLQWLDNLGHYPQLEDPCTVATALSAFINRG